MCVTLSLSKGRRTQPKKYYQITNKPVLMSPNSNKFLLLVSFISGMSVMAMEISASRLIAPHYGNTLFVWTNVIGVVLVALSLGYYYGGKLADKKPNIQTLLKPLLLAGIIFLIVPWVINPLANAITKQTITVSSTNLIFTGSLLVMLILFAFPTFLLGMISPFVIKLFETDGKHLGEMAGSVFAISTIGSIIGTFSPTLWLIPTFGTRTTITIFATLLVVLSAYGLVQKKLRSFLIFFLIFPFVTANTQAFKAHDNTILEDESIYQHIEVKMDKLQNVYLQFNEGSGIQSVYRPAHKLSGFYYDYFLPLIYFLDDQDTKEIAIIGLAGGTLSTELSHYFGDEIHIDGVEIDQKVIDIAKKYFNIENPQLAIHNLDGHIFLKYNDKKYDLIVIDAYAEQFYIPWNLTTQEFWQTVQNSLKENGIAAINVNAVSMESPLLIAITNTIAKIFPYTYIAKVSGDGGYNHMVYASNSALDLNSLPALTKNPELFQFALSISAKTEVFQHDPNQMILTDDHAPIELMTDDMFFHRFLESKSL